MSQDSFPCIVRLHFLQVCLNQQSSAEFLQPFEELNRLQSSVLLLDFPVRRLDVSLELSDSIPSGITIAE